MKIFLRTLRAF